MQIRNNVFLSLVMAGSSKGSTFEDWEKPRFGRNWWFWMPKPSTNGGRFKRHETTDIGISWLCFCVSFTVYSWGKR